MTSCTQAPHAHSNTHLRAAIKEAKEALEKAEEEKNETMNKLAQKDKCVRQQ